LFLFQRHRREIKFSIGGTLQWLKMKHRPPTCGPLPDSSPSPAEAATPPSTTRPPARCDPGKVEMFCLNLACK